MDINYLVDFGMTKTEAKVYLEILNIGETPIGYVIQRTELHRGTVYNSINNLVKKGFLSFIDKDGVRYYKFSGEKIFEEILNSDEEKIKKKKSRLKEIEKFKLEEQREANVKVLVGDKGFKIFFDSLCEWAHESKKEYLFMGRGQEMIDHFGEGYYKQTQNTKKRLGIKSRALLNKIVRKEPVSKIIHSDIKYVSWKVMSSTSTWIYDDSVVIVLWESKPILTIVIKSNEANKSYTAFFEALWNSNTK